MAKAWATTSTARAGSAGGADPHLQTIIYAVDFDGAGRRRYHPPPRLPGRPARSATTFQPTGLSNGDGAGGAGAARRQPTVPVIVAALPATRRSLGVASSSDCGVAPALLDVYGLLAQQPPASARSTSCRCAASTAYPAGAAPRTAHSGYLQVDAGEVPRRWRLERRHRGAERPYRHADAQMYARARRRAGAVPARAATPAGAPAPYVMGDVAIDQVLGISETLGPHPRGLFHRLEHFSLPTPTMAERPGSASSPCRDELVHKPGPQLPQLLPNTFLPALLSDSGDARHGIPVALYSDAPVVEDDDRLDEEMQAAITRRDRGA